MKSYFPHYFDNKNLDFLAAIRRSIMIKHDQVGYPGDSSIIKKLARNQQELLELIPTNIWNVNIPGNMEVQMEREFKKFLFVITERTSQDVTQKNVFDFYAQIDALKEAQKNKEWQNQ